MAIGQVHRPQVAKTRLGYLGMACVFGCAQVLLTYPIAGMAWDVKTSAQLKGTLSDNVDLVPSDQAYTSFYFELTPRITFTEESAHLNANIGYAPTLVFHPLDWSKNNTRNQLFGNGKLTVVEDLLFLDADAAIDQNYLSPFGPTAVDSGSNSQNFTDTTTYGLSPYLAGRLAPDIRYEARYRFKSVSDNASVTQNSHVNQWTGYLDKAIIRNFGWNLAYTNVTTDYSNRSDRNEERIIGTLNYRPDPVITYSVRAGYESNNFSRDNSSSPIYGAGFDWAPSTRTHLSANWDHRYYGEAYAVDLSHRFRYSRLSVTASRNATTFAEQFLASRPATGSTASDLLDDALKAYYPDDATRKIIVQNLMASGVTVNQLQSLYTDEVIRTDQVQVAYALLGVRNTLTFSAFWRDTSTVVENFTVATPASIGLNSNNTQTGGTITYNYQISAPSSLNVNFSRINTVSNLPGDNRESKEVSLTGTLTKRLTAKTSASIGARYRNLDSNVGTGYTEHAVFSTVNHAF